MQILTVCIFASMIVSFAHAGSISSVIAEMPGGAPVPQEKSSIGFQLENDFFAGKDQNYTNGARLSFLSKSSGSNGGDGFSDRMARTLGSLTGGTEASHAWSKFCGMERTPALRQQWAVSLTQLMFTPENINTSQPIIGQHPYAGYLALGLGTLVKNEDRANSFELQLGVTGKPSLAEQAQGTVHRMFKMKTWPGWDNQIPSEFAFCFYFKRYYRLDFLESRSRSGAFETDGLAFWHADLGTVYLRAGAGMSVRYGYNLSDTSPDFSINGATYLSSPFVKKRDYSSNWSFYGFSGMALRAVGHDLFLDGPVFHESRHYVDKLPLVLDLNSGIVLRYKQAELLIGYFLRSREYRQQERLHVIGMVELKASF